MKLSAIFAKPINRSIEGVIKADDEASLRSEVDEYVLTNEIEKRLEHFLAAYNNYEGANGVWISGFFGSGKSHLLKMLALLLENRAINGDMVLDRFVPKCGENEILRADLKRAVDIPSQSILFNIDQKADVISKSQIDALLAVFVKVFDEMCGYYGKQGYIAQFERDLDSRDLYDAFKQAFQQASGFSWETGREQAMLETQNIATAYAQVTGTPQADAVGILDKYRADYKVSIEDFADQVNDYIETKGPDFRLNFFVDEVGQYIAENVKLMTNLQTVAESLATKCRGRSWIVVTAQEDMSTVVGEMDSNRGNDFTKIQARFANRMKLTSADVAEVIRKRLLLKNSQGIELLSDVYQHQQGNFGTLFDFSDGSIAYRNFRDRDEFVHSYPFIPYQFTLFQSAIQSLSQHSAFEGRHSSVGERSMLAVFQQVANHIADYEVGRLATFDLMFEGIRSTLKSQIQRSVITAEDNLGDEFAISVLKALFLVKYVEEFKATPRNLTVLMLNSFEADLPALRIRVQEALNLLEQQTYIQRNGDEYEFLTDEEKDIEQEIKNTEVDTDSVAGELSSLVFDRVITDRKIRYDENGQDYAFSRKLDGQSAGREYELSIHVISPFNEHADNKEVLSAQSMGRDELLVVMPLNDRLLRDLVLYKQTEKYIRQNLSATQQASVQQILTNKQYQNSERMNGLRTLVEEMLAESKLIVGGQDVEVSGSDAKTRIVRGFHELLVRTYPNLRMLRGINYAESDIGNSLRLANSLFGSDEADTFSEAEQEMAAFIQSNQRSGVRTTMKSVVDRFERKPYGWYLAAIQCTLAKLWARGKVEVKRDSNILELEELERSLHNTNSYSNLVIEPITVPPPVNVRRLKEFYDEYFDVPAPTGDFKVLGQETAVAFNRLVGELSELRQQATRYPFLVSLDGAIDRLQRVCNKAYTFYLDDFLEQVDELLDLKERSIDPIRRFMSGTQREIYDEAQAFLRTQHSNFNYITITPVDRIRELVSDPTRQNGNGMTELKTLLDDTSARIQARIEEERTSAIEKVDERWTQLSATDEYTRLSQDQQAQLTSPVEALKRSLQREILIAVIRESLHRFEYEEFPKLLNEMSLLAHSEVTYGTDDYKDNDANGDIVCREPRAEYVTRSSLNVEFGKAWLETEDDVQIYLDSLRAALLEAISSGKRITLI